MMMCSNYFMYLAARGQGKTFLTALFCVVRCILFPKTKICVASATRPQANEVLLKITEDFMKNYGWGSENLKRETRRYAKRQLTWFRHNTEAKRLYADLEDGTLKSKAALIDEAIVLAKELLN